VSTTGCDVQRRAEQAVLDAAERLRRAMLPPGTILRADAYSALEDVMSTAARLADARQPDIGSRVSVDDELAMLRAVGDRAVEALNAGGGETAHAAVAAWRELRAADPVAR
jgi:hypothetical protein